MIFVGRRLGDTNCFRCLSREAMLRQPVFAIAFIPACFSQYQFLVSHHEITLYETFQLAKIARPLVLLTGSKCLGRERASWQAIVAGQLVHEVPEKQWDFFLPLT